MRTLVALMLLCIGTARPLGAQDTDREPTQHSADSSAAVTPQPLFAPLIPEADSHAAADSPLIAGSQSDGPQSTIPGVDPRMERGDSDDASTAVLNPLPAVAAADFDGPGVIRLRDLTPSPSPSDESPGVVRMSSETVTETDGFFFLSTHRSPQTFQQGLRFCPVVSRYDDCGPFRGSTFDELRSRIIPGIPVCIYIHGSFVDMASACKESVQTWHWLKNAGCGQQMQMIYVYWPSYKPFTLKVSCDVNQLGRQAARNGFYLADLVNCLPPECPVCLMGHSHGTRVIASGLHLLAGGSVQGMQHLSARANGRRIRAVLVASALDHDWLNPGHKYDRALCCVECLLNMKNSRDKALQVYPLRLPLIARRAAGQLGFTSRDRCRMGPNGCKIQEYDATGTVGREHLWPCYFNSPRLGMVVRDYVYFTPSRS